MTGREYENGFPAERPCAIVVGLDCITGLQTARLLARRGVPVVGIASDLRHFCARTRVCREIVRADTTGDEVVERLEALAGRFAQPPVLFPCTDSAVRVLSARRARLEPHYRLALPRHETVERLMSKSAMTAWAERHGFRVPATIDVFKRQDLERALERLSFPCTLKPAVKDARWLAHTKEKAFKAADADALRALFETHGPFSDHMIAQEWIEGGESELYSCNCYFGRDGEPLVSFVARKIRQWPPETGTSALGVECRADTVRDETLRLFRAADYRGLGYVEMKRDAARGEYFLIEPNVGRPTGRSAIAEAGGVELLYTMYCDLVGLPLPEAREQRYRDAKWIYLRHDLQSAFWWWRRGELTLADWARSLRGPKSYAVFSASDPLPFLLDLVKPFAELRRRRRRRGATR